MHKFANQLFTVISKRMLHLFLHHTSSVRLVVESSTVAHVMHVRKWPTA